MNSSRRRRLGVFESLQRVPGVVAVPIGALVIMFLLSCGTESRASILGMTRVSSAATQGSVLFVPGSAHVSGAAGTNWRTDLEVANPGDSQASFTVALLKRNQGNPSPPTKTFTLGSGKAVRYEDVLATVFGFSGAAALRISVDEGMVAVTSRTYNATSSGTYGQFIDGLQEGIAIQAGQEGRLIQLTHKRSASSGYRTNIGFVNATASGLALKADLYRADGSLLGGRSYNLAPYEYRQIDKIFEGVTSSDVEDGYAVLYTTTNGGSFFAYASVVDNRTGDPVYITPQVRPHASVNQAAGLAVRDVAKAGAPSASLYIPASAHVPGAAGTNWRTDLELHNPGTVQGRYTLGLLKRNQANSSPPVKTFTVAPGRSLRLEDVLDSAFGFSGAAALRITPQEGDVIVTSRTYNQTSSGTYGQFIAGVSERTALVAGEQAFQIQLSHKPGGGSGFRTNVGMLNCTDSTLAVEAQFFSSGGSSYGKKTYTLKPYEFIQVDRIFESVTGSTVADGYIRLSTTTEDGRFLAYASIIDNRTGDPVFAPAIPVLLAQPEPLPATTAAEAAFELLSLIGQDEVASFVDVANDIDERGMEAVLDDVVSELPEFVSRVPNGVRIDFGDHLVLGDDSILSGSLRFTYSNLSVTSGHHSYDFAIEEEDVVWDGQYSEIGSVTGTVDVSIASGKMVGDATFSGSGAGSQAAGAVAGISITGSAHMDTSICPNYPVSGSVTLNRNGEVYTLTFNGECDGTYDFESPGGTGALSFRLRWDGPQDLNLVVLTPDDEEISHENPSSSTGGQLDHDANADCQQSSSAPPETISWPSGKAPRGEYYAWVELASLCGGASDPPYTVEVIVDGVVKKTWHGTGGPYTNPDSYVY